MFRLRDKLFRYAGSGPRHRAYGVKGAKGGGRRLPSLGPRMKACVLGMLLALLMMYGDVDAPH